MSDHRGAQDAGCAFCRIARGEDPGAVVVAQAPGWVAFFPFEPATPGHTLVIPREHAPDFWALAPDVACDVAAAAGKVGRAIDQALQPQGMNLITSAGSVAEQTVFHTHLHVVPRWSEDGFGRIWPPERPINSVVKDDVADQVRAAYAMQA